MREAANSRDTIPQRSPAEGVTYESLAGAAIRGAIISHTGGDILLTMLQKMLLPLMLGAGLLPLGAQTKAKLVSSMRLYVFDCGHIKAMSVTTFGFKEGE